MATTAPRKTGKITSLDERQPTPERIRSHPYLEILHDRHQIFISYSRDDSAWMREIRDYIDRLPDFLIDSWVDKNRMGPGEGIDAAIQDGLDNSDIAILLVSPTFVKSTYIQTKEVPWILQRQNEGTLKVIFVPIFDSQDQLGSSKSAVEQYLANSHLDKSLSAISFGNALETTFERQDKGSRDGKVKEVVAGVRRVIDPYFSMLEQTLSDDYRIIGKVAEGASAVVYRARKEGNQGDLAIKVLKDSRDLNWFQRSLSKASYIANINNIIPIFDHRFRSSISYCVLKYIEGERLSRYIRATRPVSAEFTSKVLMKIGSAVYQVRQEKAFQNVFFNIRPENILIEFDTLEPYLSLAGRTENRRGIAYLEALKRSVANTTLEAWGYVVPEYVCPQTREPDLEVADQYLLGLMGYQMLTGKVPMRLDRDKILAGENPVFNPLGTIMGKRGFNHLMPIVAKMIDVNPANRFISLSAALEALGEPEKHSLSVVEESFRRCVRDEVTADVFFDDFYQRLMNSSADIKRIFVEHGYRIDSETCRGRGIKWQRQRQMLSHAVLLCLKHFGDQIQNSLPEPNILTFARNRHVAEKIEAGPAAYEHFLNALLDTVKALDPEWDETFHRELWSAVIRPGLDYMQN